MGDYFKPGISSGEVRWTLEDYVMQLFAENKTHTEEFKIIRGIFGDQKLADIYAKFVELKNVK